MDANSGVDIKKKLERFLDLLTGKKEILLVVHNNPDPDAVSAAVALGFLAETMCGVKYSVAYGGNITRQENMVLIRTLGVKLKKIQKIKYAKYDTVIMVDTQPRAGNNSFPANMKCHVVIDHHPPRSDTKADLVVIDKELGASATIVVQWLVLLGLAIPAGLATALAYAISSETQHMKRETSARDIEAYLYVYTKASLRKLARIMSPQLPHFYFILLSAALKNAQVYKNLIVAHIGEVESPEFIAEMADFFIRHKNISWCFCTGYKNNIMYLSLRSNREKAKAGSVIKRIVKNVNNVGGHEMSAGGVIYLDTLKKEDIAQLQAVLSSDLAAELGYENINWKTLIES